MLDRSQSLSISFLKLARLITCSMFNLTVPHFLDSKQKRNCKQSSSQWNLVHVSSNGQRRTTGPQDRTIGPPLHLQIGPSRGGQLARLSCLKQLQGKITELVLFVISFPISLLASLRIADKQKSRSSHGIWCLTCNFTAYETFFTFQMICFGTLLTFAKYFKKRPIEFWIQILLNTKIISKI